MYKAVNMQVKMQAQFQLVHSLLLESLKTTVDQASTDGSPSGGVLCLLLSFNALQLKASSIHLFVSFQPALPHLLQHGTVH